MLQDDIDFLKEIYALLKTNNYHDKDQAIMMLGDEIKHLESRPTKREPDVAKRRARALEAAKQLEGSRPNFPD